MTLQGVRLGMTQDQVEATLARRGLVKEPDKVCEYGGCGPEKIITHYRTDDVRPFVSMSVTFLRSTGGTFRATTIREFRRADTAQGVPRERIAELLGSQGAPPTYAAFADHKDGDVVGEFRWTGRGKVPDSAVAHGCFNDWRCERAVRGTDCRQVVREFEGQELQVWLLSDYSILTDYTAIRRVLETRRDFRLQAEGAPRCIINERAITFRAR